MPKLRLIRKIDLEGNWYHITKDETTIKSFKFDNSNEDEVYNKALDEFMRISAIQCSTHIINEVEI